MTRAASHSVRSATRFGARQVLVSIVAAAGLVPSASGQTYVPSSGVDNLVHPEGTSTAAIGTLGGVVKRGRGPVPMVLVPGAAFGASVFEGFMERNADRYTMYAITPAGYEGTNPWPMPNSRDMTERVWQDGFVVAIAQLIEEEKLDRPVVLGHHMMGDYAAMRLGLEHSERVRGVIVVAGRVRMPYSSKLADMSAPPGPCTAEQRLTIIKRQWQPFYTSVDRDTWVSGSFPAAQFCSDERRAAELFAQQIAVPVPTQVRYFLEYLTDDLGPKLLALSVPMLVVEPKRELKLRSVLEGNRAMNEKWYGSIDAAEAAWKQQLAMAWGSVEEGVQRQFGNTLQWQELQPRVEGMRLEFVDETGIFVMEDQPERLDAIVADFVGGLK